MGKEFTPQLVEFYEKCCRSNDNSNDDNNIMEIVYVSSDDNRTMFLETFADMPWLAMDGDDEGTRLKHSLATKLKVFRLPSLLILNVETGHFITDYARHQVEALFEENDDDKNATTKSKEKSLNVQKGKELVQKWATQEPEQLGHANTFANKALLTFNHFKKNPIYVVGIVALLLFTNTLLRVEQNPLLGMAMVYLLFTLGKEPLDKNVPYIRQEEDVSSTPNEKKKA
jgi:Thioredoxin-like